MTDAENELLSFRAGFRFGQDRGAASPREADAELRRLHRDPTDAAIAAFVAASDDGARGDAYRYLMTFLPTKGDPR